MTVGLELQISRSDLAAANHSFAIAHNRMVMRSAAPYWDIVVIGFIRVARHTIE